MKNFFYLLNLFFFLFIASGLKYCSGKDENILVQVQSDTTPPAGFPYPTIINFNYQNIPGMNSGTYGILFLMNKYYFNRFNSTLCYIWDNTGINGGPGNMRTVNYFGLIRDLTSDGRFIYGGRASNILYKFDTNMVLLNQWTISSGIFRAIAWDPGRKGFWNCDNTGDITCYDTNGVLKGTISNSLNGKFGLAFDSISQVDTAFLWVWQQDPDFLHNELYKFRIQTGQQSAVYIFNNIGYQIGVAGGAEINIFSGNPQKEMLLLNYQNTAMCVYKMKDILTFLESKQKAISGFSLSQNYPNPFNPVTTIKFTLLKIGKVNLSVYDASGKSISILVNGVVEAGHHTIIFDGSRFSSGIYYLSIIISDLQSSSECFKETKKMVLVK